MHSHSPRYIALIPAAGVGARMGAATPKQYIEIGGRPMLAHAVAAFLDNPAIDHVFIVVGSDDGWIDDALEPHDRITVLRRGGATRMDTILNGLDAIDQRQRAPAGADWVLVHDAARPGLTASLIGRLIDQVGDHAVGGLLALPVVDTVKSTRDGKDTLATVPRDGLWLAQTPQMFRFDVLRTALQAARAAGDAAGITDDASAVEALGHTPLLVEGHPRNFKVTLPRDIAIAAMYLASSASTTS